MRRFSRGVLGLGALGVVGAVGSGVACIDVGMQLECMKVEECAGKAPVCQTATACTQGACVFEATPEGVPSAQQTAGDCLQAVCDGAGKIKMVPLEADAPDDGNICTVDTCVGAAPQHTPQAQAACSTGLKGICGQGVQQCDATGQAVGGCVGPAPQAERCDVEGLDEDCDGLENEEGPGCVCGDGYLSVGEECDDGNRTNGDKCSETCTKEVVLQIAAGGDHTCALLNGGGVKCWGHNSSGQLGLGDTADRGDDPGEMGDHLPLVDLAKPAKAIAAGGNHTCAILIDGAVKCWGANNSGQLGLSDTANRGIGLNQMGANLPLVNLGQKALTIVAGYEHTCALLTDGSIKCWGANKVGQLGMGDTTPRGDDSSRSVGDMLPIDLGKPSIAVAAGYAHTCALLEDGSLKCWGANSSGQLGLGHTANRGDKPGQMGTNLLSVDLGSNVVTKDVAAGDARTCALLSNGKVKCWGRSYSCDSGLPNFDDCVGDKDGEMGDHLASLNVDRSSVALSLGGAQLCVTLEDGTASCWAYREETFTEHHGNWDTRVFRCQEFARDANLKMDGVIVYTSAGGSHMCELSIAGSVRCWGLNSHGQLGNGDNTDHEVGANSGDALPTVKLYSDTW